MAITKASILTRVNLNLQVAETDIDFEIQETLDDLSEMDFLKGVDTSQTLTSGDTVLVYPTGFRAMINIVLILNSIEQHPLIKLPQGHEEYRSLRHNDDSVGIPRWYSIFNEQFFLWRPPNDSFTSRIEYYKDHPQDVDTIEFGDIFKNAINAGVTYRVAARKRMTANIAQWLPIYENAKDKRDDATYRNPRIVKG